MPEYQLPISGHRVPVAEHLDEFTRGFIEAAFFMSRAEQVYREDWFTDDIKKRRDDYTLDGTIPCDSNLEDIDPRDLADISAFCRFWQVLYNEFLEAAYHNGYTRQLAGRDLYYTMVGHGVGFWDREELDFAYADDTLGNKLTSAAGDIEFYLEFDGESIIIAWPPDLLKVLAIRTIEYASVQPLCTWNPNRSSK